jgi:hypothetical protein
MLAVTLIEGFRVNRLPSPDEVKGYFLENEKHQWSSGGSIAIYGAYGTENEEPGRTRIELWLTMSQHPSYGFYLIYSTIGLSPHGQWHSLGDASRLSSDSAFVDIDDNGYCIAEGLFVPPRDAWAVVKYFIETQGERSDTVCWLSDAQVPASAIISPYPD